MFSIRHIVGINGAKEKIFNALSSQEGLAKWWTVDTKAENYEGGTIQFSFEKRLSKKYDVLVKIIALKPDKVSWAVIEGPEEWMNTEITFDIQSKDEGFVIYFNHAHWKELTEFMTQCNTKWAVFLLSLKDLIETGQGRPFPNDIRIGYNGA